MTPRLGCRRGPWARAAPVGRAVARIMAFALAVGAPSLALARERIAVLIVPGHDGDRALTDNLTEVAISRLAEISDFDLMGTRELRRRLASTGSGELPIDCLNDAPCLDHVGLTIGVRRLLSGSVRPEGSRFLVALAINDLESGKVDRSFFRAVDGGLDSLIRTVQDGVDDLFRQRSVAGQLRIDSVPEGAAVVVDEQYRGTTPLWVNPMQPGNHRLRVEMSGRFPWKKEFQLAPGQNLLLSVNREDLGPRRSWAPYLAYGTAAVALLSFAAAGLFGTLARAEPTGSTRGEAQMDLELRNEYAAITNVLLIVGGTLSGISTLTFVRLRRDIFGD